MRPVQLPGFDINWIDLLGLVIIDLDFDQCCSLRCRWGVHVPQTYVIMTNIVELDFFLAIDIYIYIYIYGLEVSL